MGVWAKLWRKDTMVLLNIAGSHSGGTRKMRPLEPGRKTPSLGTIPLVPSTDKAWCRASWQRSNSLRVQLQHHEAWPKRVDLELRNNILVAGTWLTQARRFFLTSESGGSEMQGQPVSFCSRKSSKIQSPYSSPLRSPKLEARAFMAQDGSQSSSHHKHSLDMGDMEKKERPRMYEKKVHRR